MSSVHVSLHNLSAAELVSVHVHESNVGVCIRDARTQLHWDSLDDLDAWVRQLEHLAGEARRCPEYSPGEDDEEGGRSTTLPAGGAIASAATRATIATSPKTA